MGTTREKNIIMKPSKRNRNNDVILSFFDLWNIEVLYVHVNYVCVFSTAFVQAENSPPLNSSVVGFLPKAC